MQRITGALALITVLTMLALCACAPARIPPASPLPGPAVLLPPPRMTIPPIPAEEEIPPAAPPVSAEMTVTTPPAPDIETSIPPAAPQVLETAVTAPQPAHFQSFASHYAKRFKGRRTASGERYDPDLMTAATQDFPLHSWLKVVNPANGREVVVRINDRTAKRKTPLIDLSHAAAKRLGFLGKGKIRIHVIPLPSPPNPPR